MTLWPCFGGRGRGGDDYADDVVFLDDDLLVVVVVVVVVFVFVVCSLCYAPVLLLHFLQLKFFSITQSPELTD